VRTRRRFERTAKRHGNHSVTDVDHNAGSGYTDGVPNTSTTTFTIDGYYMNPDVEQRLGDSGNPEVDADKIGYVTSEDIETIESTSDYNITAGDVLTDGNGREFRVVVIDKESYVDIWRLELEEVNLDG